MTSCDSKMVLDLLERTEANFKFLVLLMKWKGVKETYA